MQRAVRALLLLGLLLLLLPAIPAEAESVIIGSSTFASSSVSSTVTDIGNWFQRTLGIDLFEIISRIINFMILVIKVTINVLLEILPRIRDLLSAY